jgi:hypothetical protein
MCIPHGPRQKIRSAIEDAERSRCDFQIEGPRVKWETEPIPRGNA